MIRKTRFPLLLLVLVAGFALAQDEGKKKDRPVDKLTIPPLKPFDPPKAEPKKLANGITAWLLEDHELPLVEVEVVLRAGSIWDPEDKVGLASLAGSVWRKGGTKTHPNEKLDEILEKHGASLEASIGHDQGSVHLSCLKEDLDLGLGLMMELLTEPTFDKEKLKEAKTEVESEIERRNDTGPPIAGRVFSMQVYGKTSPYARVVTPESLKKITRDDLVAWHKKFVRPAAAIVGAFGDQSLADLEKKLGATLGSWKVEGDAPAPTMPLVEATRKAKWIFVNKPEINQSAIEIGHIGSVRSPDLMDEYTRMIVMNEILGGGGFSSRLMLRVRSDQSLAYSVWSAPGWNYDHPGSFIMGCETKSESTVQAIKSLLKELHEIRTELPTEEEVAVAKESTLNKIPFSVDTNEKMLDNALRYAYRNFPQDTLSRFVAGIQKVTAKDVLESARKSWDEKALVVVVCGNAGEVDMKALKELAGGDLEVVEDAEAWATGSVSTPKPPEEGAKKETSGILDKMLQAAGGKDAVLALKSPHTKEKMTEGENESVEEKTIEFPDKARRIMETPQGKITIVLNGDKCTAVVPGQGAIKVEGAQLASVKGELLNMSAAVFRAAAKGDVKVISEDDDTFGGKKAKKVVLEAKGARKQVWFLDAETGALLGKEQDLPPQAGGGKMRITVAATKDAAGVKLPAKLTIKKIDGKGAEEDMGSLEITEMEANPKIAEDTFKVPEGKQMQGGDDDGE